MKRAWARKACWTLALLLLLTAVPIASAEESQTDSTGLVSGDTSFFPDIYTLIAPTPTPEPLTNAVISSVEYIFGGSSDELNSYNHRLMAEIAAFGDIVSYVNTKWPGAQGRRAPMWKDFSPTKPTYTPALGLFMDSTTDQVGQEWYYYGLIQEDLTLQDWQVTLINGAHYWNCEYERGVHRSPWISKNELGLEKIMLSRMITANAGYSITYDASGQRVMTTVAWRDADYNIKWDWHETEGANMLLMSWNDSSLALYLLFREDDGMMLNAVVTEAAVSESSVYEVMLRNAAGQLQ